MYHRKSIEERFWPKVDVKGPDDCWEWVACKNQPNGYGVVRVIDPISGKWSMSVAHRVAWELVNGPIPEGLEILHSCDNRGCVNPSHLFAGTQQDNMDDKVAKGRQRFGATVPSAILDASQVQEIRALRGLVSTFELGRRYGIAQTTVSAIQLHKTWQSVI